jgi:TolA-binding protein
VSEQSYWTQLEELERGDKRRALSYALAGEEWYSDVGKPAEARRAKIVTLMVDLGQMSEARERARAFIEQYPRSPYRHLVQGTTGIHPRPGAPPH